MIVRDVDADALSDLVARPRRATLAVDIDERIALLPVGFSADDPAHPKSLELTVIAPAGSPSLARRAIVVIVDDGPQWFRLRGVMFRGTAIPAGEQTYRIAPTRVVAWDDGSLRHDPAAAQSTVQPAAVPTTPPQHALTPCASAGLTHALRTSRVMIVGTRSPRGTPFAVPLWFTTREGRLYTTTSATSWTVRNASACPEVSILLGGETGNSDRLIVTARARVIAGVPPPAVLVRMAWRYYLSPRFAASALGHMRLWFRRAQYYRQSRPAYLVITPQSETSCAEPISER